MNGAVRKHGFDAEDERAHRPELQHLRSSGVRRREAADGAAAPRAQGQRKALAGLRGAAVQVGEDHARFGNGHTRVDRSQPVHASQGKDQGGAVGRRGRTADHPRIATLGHQRHPMLNGQPNHGRRFLGRRWREDRFGLAVEAAAPVGEPGLEIGRVRDDGFRAEALPGLVDDGRNGTGCHSLALA